MVCRSLVYLMVLIMSLDFSAGRTVNLSASREIQKKELCFDMVFAVDRSLSMGWPEGSTKQPLFEEQLRKVETIMGVIVDTYKFGPTTARIKGLVTFDKRVQSSKIDTTDPEEMKKQLKVVRPYDPSVGGTNTWDALKEARKLMPKAESGDKARVIVMMTDGKPYLSSRDNNYWNTEGRNDAYKYTKIQAEINNEEGIDTLVIKLPNKNHADENFNDVFNLLTNNRMEQTLDIESLDDITQTAIDIVSRLKVRCKREKKCPIDMAFALDRSWSITEEDVAAAKDLMQEIAMNMDNLNEKDDDLKATLALFSYNKKVYPHGKGKDCDSIDCIKKEIQSIPNTRDNFTRSDLAIKECSKYFNDPENKMRKDVAWVCVLFTDGRSWKPSANDVAMVDRSTAVANTDDTIQAARENKTPGNGKKPMFTEIVGLPNWKKRSDKGEWLAVASHWVLNGNEEDNQTPIDQMKDVLARGIAENLCSVAKQWQKTPLNEARATVN